MSDATPSYPEVGFARLADDFVNAARLVAGEDEGVLARGHGFPPLLFPFLFLVGHALELAYKAVLVGEGVTEQGLKKMGHDLAKCRGKIQVCCPGLLEELEEPGTDEIVRMIGPYYKAKSLEYHMTGSGLGLPASPQVATVAVRTVQNIQDWVWSTVRQRIRDRRGAT